MSAGRSADRPPSRPSDPVRRELAHRAAQVGVVVDDLHRAAAEHVRRADEHRVADRRARSRPPSSTVDCDAAGRLRDAEPLAQRVELLAVLGRVDRRGRVPRMGMPCVFEDARELQRRLAAERDDDAPRARRAPAASCSRVADVEHVFVGERLEEEAVARVVVGGDGLGIAVDHHRLVARVAQRERGVHAAVVELDALADPVRTAAEDHDGAAASSGASSSSSS